MWRLMYILYWSNILVTIKREFEKLLHNFQLKLKKKVTKDIFVIFMPFSIKILAVEWTLLYFSHKNYGPSHTPNIILWPWKVVDFCLSSIPTFYILYSILLWPVEILQSQENSLLNFIRTILCYHLQNYRTIFLL